MANPELGTKRVCPETGRKFYDLNKDPIVSPFTGKEYPISFFEAVKAAPRGRVKEAVVEEEVETTEEADSEEETVSLAEVEEDENVDAKDAAPDVDAEDEEVELEEDDADTFLEDEEDEDDDVADIIGGRDEDDEV